MPQKAVKRPRGRFVSLHNQSLCEIYALCDPDTGEVRYLGKTEVGIRYRLQTHIADNSNTYKACWIRSLKREGKKPTIVRLQIVPCAEWEAWECSWIAVLKEAGARLTNFTDRGERGPLANTWTLTEENRKNISLGRKAYFEQMRAAGTVPPAHNKGKRLSETTRQKISEARRGRGHPHSLESRRKISEGNQRRVWTPEMRANASAGAKRRFAAKEVTK